MMDFQILILDTAVDHEKARHIQADERIVPYSTADIYAVSLFWPEGDGLARPSRWIRRRDNDDPVRRTKRNKQLGSKWMSLQHLHLELRWMRTCGKDAHERAPDAICDVQGCNVEVADSEPGVDFKAMRRRIEGNQFSKWQEPLLVHGTNWQNSCHSKRPLAPEIVRSAKVETIRSRSAPISESYDRRGGDG